MSAPRASRPHIPDYGIPTGAAGMLTWDEVARAFGTSPRYWIATTNPDGSPHVIQQWGAFVEHEGLAMMLTFAER